MNNHTPKQLEKLVEAQKIEIEDLKSANKILREIIDNKNEKILELKLDNKRKEQAIDELMK